MDPGLVQMLAGSGPLGLIILYMMYLEKWSRENRKVERERRDAIDKDRIETDKALVAAMTTLADKIDGLGK